MAKVPPRRQPCVSENESRFETPQKEDGSQRGVRTCMVRGVNDEKPTREVQLEFCAADVPKLVTSAVRWAAGGNGIWHEAHRGHIVNLATKDRMEVRDEDGAHVIDMQIDGEIVDFITLDKGAGCNVWPKGRRGRNLSKLRPKKAGVGMVTATDMPIQYHKQRWVRFRGVRSGSGFLSPR